MKSLKSIIIALIFLLFIPFFSNEAHAETVEKQRVFDDANLLSDDEVEKLEKLAAKYSKKRETDFIIITQENIEIDIEQYMDDFYDEEGLGYDKKHGNTAMIGLDMTERDVVLHGFAKAQTYLDPDRLTQIREKITPYLSEGNYYTAFESYILLVDKYMNYRPGVNPENPIYRTWVQFIIAIGLGAVIVGGMAYNVKPKMTTTPGTYRDTERSKVLQRRDRYIRTTVTKRRKPKQSSGGGGSGRSGGSIGRTSGGFSRSSSRGKF
ncbi:TPM domain-containing protein [Pseudogracilibacillus auburnensis]|uniref:TPM domain-containing protein n=1 Tax=Pseudogracilibacillus auburnensis TaxID=1494959 RepID=UPI001A97C21C|nr:TPM domain-containing protein [Pseudogracilibacillus auburnensis]MBO1002462.1 TPM domain-containing protein [Pseudogracilibacillus auburnensis]